MPYLLLKTLHVIGAVLFLGNVITGIFWKAHGDRLGDRGDLRSRVQALDGIIRADRVFTVPSVFLIIATGVCLVLLAHLSFLTPWILGPLVLVGLAGAVFGARVGPLQKKLLANARTGLTGAWNESEYRRLSQSWRLWGWVATVLPLLALVLMVLKPTW
jgi:uncharacterized membrane protein